VTENPDADRVPEIHSVAVTLSVDDGLTPIGRAIIALGEAPESTATAIADVLVERGRHAHIGYDAEHDDQHSPAELATFARGYLERAAAADHPSYEHADLVKAASVVLAAIERTDRLAAAAEAGAL
jgi:hypothetical protein